ncbi:MAG: DUF1569 domain-containing protein [Planctomycetota bacterium]
MPSLFDAEVNAQTLARIDALAPDARPQWGKLSLAGMLAHCAIPLRSASGEAPLKRSLIGRLLGGLVKKKFLSDAPFARNGPTDPRLLVADPRDVEAERAELRRLVADFGARGPAILAEGPHPFFGPLTDEEWGLLMWKHLDHHLTQFGA